MLCISSALCCSLPEFLHWSPGSLLAIRGAPGLSLALQVHRQCVSDAADWKQKLAQLSTLAKHDAVYGNSRVQCYECSVRVSFRIVAWDRPAIVLPCHACCRSRSRLRLEAVTRRVLPEHTRDALFQLFCDVRANTPKDRVFVVRHAQALQPRTFSGWLVSFVSGPFALPCYAL